MDQDKYDLVFSGKVAPGCELAQTKSNLKALFRIDSDKVEALFSGNSIVLKKGLDADTANKYRAAMRKAGAVAFMVPIKASDAKPSPKPAHESNSAKANPRESSSSAVEAATTSSFTTELGAQASSAPQPRQTIDAPDFDLASVGESLLKDEEREHIAPVSVDISALSLREQTGNLVQDDELARPEPAKVNDLDAIVAPAGSDVLKPEERRKTPKVEVDTSSMSVADVGERLSKPGDPPPPPPNVDHIKLEQD